MALVALVPMPLMITRERYVMVHNRDELQYVASGSNFDQCSTKANCIDFFIFMFIAFSDRYCHYSLEKKN